MGYAAGTRTEDECSRLPVPIDEFKARILEMAAESRTITEICADLGVSRATFYGFKNRHPEFKALVETTLFDASIELVDKLKQIPFNEAIDVSRARVQIEGIRTHLELRWPGRYGKRMQVTVTAVDMAGAIRRATARVDELNKQRAIDSTCERVDDTVIHDAAAADVSVVALAVMENSCENNDVSTIDELL